MPAPNLIGIDRVEVYRACAWILNSDGSPKCVLPADGTLYTGEEIDGVQDFKPAVPEPRVLPGVAQGTVQDTFILPSITARKATMHSLYDLFSTNANLQGVKTYDVAGMEIIPLDTDQEGLEPTTTLLVSALVGHDKDTGDPIWVSQLYPRARIFPLQINGAFDATVGQFPYTITWAKSTKEFWGTALSLATMGALKSGARGILTNNRPNFGCWLTDGVIKDFLFDTNKPCVNPTDVVAYDYATGLAISPAPASVDATGVHFSVAPAADVYIIAPYQY